MVRMLLKLQLLPKDSAKLLTEISGLMHVELYLQL